MRLVTVLALTVALAGTAAWAVPPPPPPPMLDVPEEIGGYSSNEMNSVYETWLRRQVATAGEKALRDAGPKNYGEAASGALFSAETGPTVTARSPWGDQADLWRFVYACPKVPATEQKLDPLDERDGCAWQALWVTAQFSRIEEAFGTVGLRPDFNRLAEALRAAKVDAAHLWDAPDTIFAGIGDVAPLLARAIEVRTLTAAECPALTAALADLEQKKVTVDIQHVGQDRERPPVLIEPALFEARLPLVGGEASLFSAGPGEAYDSWHLVNERLGPCARDSSRRK